MVNIEFSQNNLLVAAVSTIMITEILVNVANARNSEKGKIVYG